MANESLLKDPAFFHCGRFNCDLLKIRCVERQINRQPFIHLACQDCKQGKRIAQEIKMEQSITIEPKKKICRQCGNRKTLEDGFSKNAKSKDGYMHICKVCQGERISKGHWGEKSISNKPTLLEPGIPKQQIEPSTLPDETYLHLNCKDYPDIIQALKNQAHDNVRTIEQQAIFLLRSLTRDAVLNKNHDQRSLTVS